MGISVVLHQDRVDTAVAESSQDRVDVDTTHPAPTRGRSAPRFASLRPGVVVDGYRLERLAGGGGFAEVHQVTTPLDATLAMKILRPGLAAVPEEHARFRWESRLMNTVRHPGVPCALAEGETPDGRPYFVMDWIDGETLEARRLRMGGQLPPHEVRVVGLHLVAILEAVHAAGVLHLDFKPENVFLTREGRVVLGDFGIARWIDARDEDAVRGTPLFMAPEQFLGRGLGPWSDVRALGATLFVLLTGRPACPTAALRHIVTVASSKVRPLLSVLPSAPRPLALAIDGALVADPAARPTVREFGRALRDARAAR